MTRRDSLDRSLTDSMAPIADEAPLPDGMLRVPGAWIRSGRAAPPMRLLALAAVVAVAAVVTLAGVNAIRGGLSVPFIGGPREPIAIPSLDPDEMRTIEEADRVIHSTLTAEEWATVGNSQNAVIEACMQELGWDFEVGTATADTDGPGPATMSRLELWTFADVSAAQSVGYGFDAYLAEHAVWLAAMQVSEAESRIPDAAAMSPDEAARFEVDYFGTEAERIVITERDGSHGGIAGGGCLAEGGGAIYGDIERQFWLNDARGTADGDIWLATVADPTVTEALDWWRDCLAEHEVYFADPDQAYSGALQYARSGDFAEERRIAIADATCKLESGLDRAVSAAFLAATNAVLPALEADLIALQQLEEEALVRAREILAAGG